MRVILLMFFLAVACAYGQNTDAELTTQAQVIRDETSPGGNTKLRVYNMFKAIIDSKVNLARTLTINGTTYDLSANRTWTVSGVSGLTTNRVPYATSSTTLGDDSALTWDFTNNALTIGSSRFFTMTKAGGEDIYIGQSAGNFSSTGQGANVNIGYLSGSSYTTAQQNTAVGYLAGFSLTSSNANSLFGFGAGSSITSGAGGNALFGSAAGASITTNGKNSIFGNNAADDLTGSANSFFGYGTGINQAITGDYNVLIGSEVKLQSLSDNGQLSIQNAIFGSGNTDINTTISSGNLGLWATSWGTSASKVLSWGVGTAPSTSPADMIQMYVEDVASSAELKVRDEANNITTLSPHNFSVIGEPSEQGAWSFYGEFTNKITGERQAINVDMLRVIRILEQISGEKLVHVKSIK